MAKEGCFSDSRIRNSLVVVNLEARISGCILSGQRAARTLSGLREEKAASEILDAPFNVSG